MKSYAINTECGLMTDIQAESIDAAKEIYSAATNGYDFDGAANGEYPGSWYTITEDGVRVDDYTVDMPRW